MTLEISGTVHRLHPRRDFRNYSFIIIEIHDSTDKRYYIKLQQFRNGGNIALAKTIFEEDEVTVTFDISCKSNKFGTLCTDLLLKKLDVTNNKGFLKNQRHNKLISAYRDSKRS